MTVRLDPSTSQAFDRLWFDRRNPLICLRPPGCSSRRLQLYLLRGVVRSWLTAIAVANVTLALGPHDRAGLAA